MDYKTYNIGGHSVGGDFSNPTLLISSLFYSGQNIVSDPDKGIFNEDKAKSLIKKQKNCSRLFEIPTCIDLVAETPEAMNRYLHFVSGEFQGPIIIDGFIKARIEGLKLAKDLGIMDRIIYNSIWKNQHIELETMKETGLKTAILFAYDVADSSASKRFSILTEGTAKYDSLLSITEKVGVTQLLIDNVLTTDLYSLSDAIESNIMIKSMFGYPVGCGPANINYLLSKAENAVLDKRTSRIIRETAVNSMAQLFSDFILIGPIERMEKACVGVNVVNKIKMNLNFDPFDLLKKE